MANGTFDVNLEYDQIRRESFKARALFYEIEALRITESIEESDKQLVKAMKALIDYYDVHCTNLSLKERKDKQ